MTDSDSSKHHPNKKPVIFILVLLAVLTAGLIALAVYYLANSNPTFRGAIAANGKECAQIGRSIFEKDGNVIDVAIAVIFCEGVAMPQSTGLGGGFILTFYNRTSKKTIVLNARERAPLISNETMFSGSKEQSSTGPLSIAVPGELKGLWELHQAYGSLSWAELVQPSIDLARNGHFVSPLIEKILAIKKNGIFSNKGMREIYIDPKTNDTWKHGQYIKRPILAKTLKVIAEENSNALYNGSLTDEFVTELKELGSIITREDLEKYEVEWQDPISTEFKDKDKLYTSNLPSSGPLLIFIMNILDGFLERPSFHTALNWHRIIETFKFAYGSRSVLGDSLTKQIHDTLMNVTSKSYSDLIREKISDNKTYNDPAHYNANFMEFNDFGTAHIAIIAPNGDAVSSTGTINSYFGSLIRSTTTGIVLNNEMDDFSTPNMTNLYGIAPSSTNYIIPGKRPLSSMCPSIVLDRNDNVKLVIGGAGGSKITTATALGAIRYLWFDNSIKKALSSKRLHHQLYPMRIQVEYGFDQKMVAELKKYNHSMYQEGPSDAFAAILGLGNRSGIIEGALDPRRLGSLVV